MGWVGKNSLKERMKNGQLIEIQQAKDPTRKREQNPQKATKRERGGENAGRAWALRNGHGRTPKGNLTARQVRQEREGRN